MDTIFRAPPLTPEQVAQLAQIDTKVVPGRGCGTCTLCCKVVSVADFGKPAGTWCQHCRPGNGCGIHAIRPFVCRGAYCEWMICKGLGPEWKPEKSKFVLFKTHDGRRLTAHVDPGYPSAWRRSPFYENFKLWAAQAIQQEPMHLVDVMIGDHLTVVLPDREVDVGILGPDELVQLNKTRTAAGESISVERIKRPPAAGARPAA